MTREEAIKILRREIECLSHTKCEDCILEAVCDPIKTTPYDSEYIEVYEMAIKALETLEEFEKAQIITGGRLNGRTYAYKCGLEDGKCKALEQKPCEEHQREFIELVVEYPNPDLCTYPEYRGKPYFSIKYRENGKYIVGYGSYKIEMISQWIKEYFIPSVQPKPKTGHWEQYGNSWEDKFKCSECGKEQPKILCGERIIGHWSDYCPNCGADMRESEE